MATFTSSLPSAVVKHAIKLNLQGGSGANKEILFMYLPKGRERRNLLGRGSYGHVYAAYDFENGKNIAVKEFEVDSGCFESMCTEAKDLIPINLQHKNIVKYLGYAFHDGYLKLFMEQIDGGTLARLVKKHPLKDDIDKLRDFTSQIMDGLAFLHDKDIIHRDIKGDNILVAHGLLKQQLKIADFGTCCRIREYYKGSKVEGTLPYLSPEIIREHLYSAKSDVWALGCTIVEMGQGYCPHKDLVDAVGRLKAEEKILNDPVPPSVPDDFPEVVITFVKLCTVVCYKERSSLKDLYGHPLLKKVSETPMEEVFVECRPVVRTESEVRRILRVCRAFQSKDERGDKRRTSQPVSLLGDNTTLEQLVKADIDAEDNTFLHHWFQLCFWRLKETQIHNQEWMQSVLDLLAKLGNCVNKDSSEELLIVYTYSLCLVYMAALAECLPKVLHDSHLQITATAHEAAVKRLTSDNGPPYRHAMIHKCAELLGQLKDSKKWKKVNKRSRSLFTHQQTSKRKNIMRMLVTTFTCEETASDVAGFLATEINKVDTSFEKTLCIVYSGMKGAKNSVALEVFKQSICQNIEQIKKEPWIAILVAETYVWLVQEAPTVDDCEAVLGQSVGELGLQGFLRRLEKDALYPEVIYVCCDLLYHQCGKVRNEIDTLSGDVSLNCVSLAYHRRLAQNLLRGQNLRLDPGGVNSNLATSFVFWGQFGNMVPVEVQLWRNKNPQKEEEKEVISQDNKYHDNLLDTMLSVSTDTHKNVCQVLAFQSRNDPMLLVLETVKERQDLGRYILERRNTFPELSFNEMLDNFVIPAIDAISFFHGKGIILRNLTADSFITEKGNDKGNLKLYLLDMASCPNETDHVSGVKVTKGEENEMQGIPLLFSAPETIITSINSIESDCYMLGHTIIQILTMGCQPYYHEKEQTTEQHCLQVLLENRRPKRPECIPKKTFEVISTCFDVDPKKRIPADKLLEDLMEYRATKTLSGIDIPGTRRADTSLMPPATGKYQPSTPVNGVPDRLKKVVQILSDMRKHQGVNVPNVTMREGTFEILSGLPVVHDEPYPDVPRRVSRDHHEVELFTLPSESHMQVLLSLHHPHVASVRPGSREGNHRKLLIGPIGSTTLWDFARCLLPLDITKDLLPFFVQIAKGLHYLHLNHLIHANLHPDFIYIEESVGPSKARIGHFGRIIFLGKEHDELETRKPSFHTQKEYKYSAARRQPVEVNTRGHYSFASDVGSFGLVMLETILVYLGPMEFPLAQKHHFQPYKQIPANKIGVYQDRCALVGIPSECPDWLSCVINLCLHRDPQKRPTPPEIVECFESRWPNEHSLVISAKEYVKEEKRKSSSVKQQELLEELGQNFPDYIIKQ